MGEHQEKRDCGCVLLHRRVAVCKRHARMSEKLRDQISEMTSRVVAEEIEAAVSLERDRWKAALRSVKCILPDDAEDVERAVAVNRPGR